MLCSPVTSNITGYKSSILKSKTTGLKFYRLAIRTKRVSVFLNSTTPSHSALDLEHELRFFTATTLLIIPAVVLLLSMLWEETAELACL
jgi:hypothetical protein